MKNIIIANWKCNPASLKEAKKLFNKVKKETEKIKSAQVVVCPPFAWLAVVSPKRNKGGLILGAQNVCFENTGAFTGEVSVLMLKDLGAEYVIIGHSERRKYFNETDVDINKKIKKSLDAKLKVIFCIGETKEEWEAHQKPEVLERQIAEGLKDITRDEIKNVIIAYEPVWAIGTGNNCSVDETMSSIIFIRKIVSELYNREIADNIKVIYGGSVKSENSEHYIKDSGANGLLVGGASLNPEEFIKIVRTAI
jgi:triosephosphate isomerase (TIM)